ncbi:MAG: GNAT family N-acetyltransferase [Firmicutes bacterium]|nr:GNAT family N-acetyltransferase [Bacillota bacterium]
MAKDLAYGNGVLILQTAIKEVWLGELTSQDTRAFYELVQRNREHLTQFGDYQELVASTLQDIEDYFAAPPVSNTRMGIWRGADELMGRVDLAPVGPGAFVLGYWIGSEYVGYGYVTAACLALMDYGQEELGATDFWAGVTHGNDKSAAVLKRLGFRTVERLAKHTRFHRKA